MKDKLAVGVIVAAIFLVVAIGIAIRLGKYFGFYLGFSVPWFLILILSAAGAAILLFWPGRSS